MRLQELAEYLKLRMHQPLPGPNAQLSLTSKQLIENKNIPNEAPIATARQSSVLIMLYEKNDNVYIPLIQRPTYEGVHSGQIALPGGKLEPDDISEIHTALREAREEIGVLTENIEVIGTLTSVYIAPSRFNVNVILSYHPSEPIFIPDTYEVAKLIELPIEHLLNDHIIENREVISAQNWKMNAPGFVFEDYFIWGATAKILNELKYLIKELV